MDNNQYSNIHSFNNYDWFNNSETLRQFKYIDLRELIANHASRLLWGNGFILSSPNEKIKDILQEVDETNNLISFFYQVEKILSSFGFTVVTIDKTEDGKILLNQSSPYALSRIAYVADEELACTVWSRIVYSDSSSGYIKTVYTDKTITREFLDTEYNVIAGEALVKLQKQYRLPLYERHDYGFIPVVFMQNVPKKNNWMGSTIGSYYNDLVPVSGLQNLINFTFSSLNHELEFNRTRVFANLSPLALSQAQLQLNNISNNNLGFSDYQRIKKWTSDFIIKSTEGVPGTNEFNILEGKPNEVYLKILDWTLSSAYEGAGYSYKDAESKDATATELQLSKANDTKTTKLKRFLRTQQYKKMFKKILGMLDYKKIKRDDLIFEIKENLIIDEIKKIEIANQRITMGISSRLREIQKEYGVSLEEAKEIKTQIDKENEEDNMYVDKLLENKENELEVEEDNEYKNTDIKDSKPS